MGYVRELRALVGHRPLVLAVAGALVVDATGRVLLHRRTDNGLWGTPGGAVEPRNSFSDASGIAEARWILGPSGGTQQVRAVVRKGAPVIFEATAEGQ